MTNTQILKFILPIFGLILISICIDHWMINYLPSFQPIETFRNLLKLDNKYLRILVYLAQWYGIYGIIWVSFHILLTINFTKSFNFDKLKQKLKLFQQIQEYQTLPTCQQSSTKNEAQNNIQSSKQNQSQKVSTLTRQIDYSFFSSIICPYITAFLTLFVVSFLIIALIQSQIAFISSSFKHGTHHSRWMGATEYYTLDFFHNVPHEFQNNNKLMDLFEIQDGSVSSVKNWLGNYKLFFGLFYLALESVGLIGIGIFCGLIIMCKRIQHENAIKINDNQSLNRFKTTIKYCSQSSLFNIVFVVFIGFSVLSALFLQLKLKNSQHLCLPKQQIGGFLLRLDKRIQTQIFSVVMKQPNLIKNTISEPNKHQILFVFQNLCEIFNPYYVKVIHLQQIFLFAMRMGEIFFAVTLILMLWSKFKQTVKK